MPEIKTSASSIPLSWFPTLRLDFDVNPNLVELFSLMLTMKLNLRHLPHDYIVFNIYFKLILISLSYWRWGSKPGSHSWSDCTIKIVILSDLGCRESSASHTQGSISTTEPCLGYLAPSFFLKWKKKHDSFSQCFLFSPVNLYAFRVVQDWGFWEYRGEKNGKDSQMRDHYLPGKLFSSRYLPWF